MSTNDTTDNANPNDEPTDNYDDEPRRVGRTCERCGDPYVAVVTRGPGEAERTCGCDVTIVASREGDEWQAARQASRRAQLDAEVGRR